MIEFNKDSNLQPPVRHFEHRGVILAIGGAGIHIADNLILHAGHSLNIIAMDTDAQTIRASVAAEKILLGERILRGLGAGGDPESAADAIHDDIDSICQRCGGASAIIVLTGLGGGTGSGCAPVLVGALRDMGIPVSVVAVSPYHFEGSRRLQQASNALHAIATRADSVCTFSNDRLLHLPEAQSDIRQGLHAMNRLIGEAVRGVATIMEDDGLLAAKPADLRELTRGATKSLENAWIGSGEATGNDRVQRAVAQVTASPLFEDGRVWREASALIVSVCTGEKLSISELQEVVQSIKALLPVELEITSGATVDESMGDSLRIILIAGSASTSSSTKDEPAISEPAPRHSVRTRTPAPHIATASAVSTVTQHAEQISEEHADVESPVEASAAKHQDSETVLQPAAAATHSDGSQTEPEDHDLFASSSQRYFAEQKELGLDNRPNKGIFDNSRPTIRNGQDLDTPTFMRRRIAVRL